MWAWPGLYWQIPETQEGEARATSPHDQFWQVSPVRCWLPWEWGPKLAAQMPFINWNLVSGQTRNTTHRLRLCNSLHDEGPQGLGRGKCLEWLLLQSPSSLAEEQTHRRKGHLWTATTRTWRESHSPWVNNVYSGAARTGSGVWGICRSRRPGSFLSNHRVAYNHLTPDPRDLIWCLLLTTARHQGDKHICRQETHRQKLI